MRCVAILVLTAICGVATTTAYAQEPDRRDDRRVLKVVIGAGALVAGVAVAAKSSKTTKTTGALGTTETSEFSTSQLITGLAVAGTGGFLLWDGLRDHDRARPYTRVGVGLGPKAAGLLIERAW
jgi:hypothetical protein